jgi:uncharacterized DUF497 family protein
LFRSSDLNNPFLYGQKYASNFNSCMYNKAMLIEYDPVKDQINQEKHGVSLAQAGFLDWATALIRTDTRFDYREARYQALGLPESRVYLAALTLRDDALRIISLRRANRREERRYEEVRNAENHASL